MKRFKIAPFKWCPFSKKQLKVLTWWMPDSPHKDKDAIICDGSVRAGKTIVMSFSFVVWVMKTFNYQNFGMAGKTIGTFRRNVLFWLKIILRLRGYKVDDRRADNLVIIQRGQVINYFYIFGGKDERSQDLVQGITAAGFLFDEVALMPESFVNQAVARCSVEGAKLWFNCNPDSPVHWFKVSWLDKLSEKNALHLHFTMDDNPSLSEKTKERYRRMFVGVFFKRFILGLWVMAEGAIYDMWDDEKNLYDDSTRPVALNAISRRFVACDYGTTNPMVFLDIYDDGTTIWIDNEYYYDSKEKGGQKTDSQYADDLEKFVSPEEAEAVVLDPSAASFKTELRARGYRVKDADNEVNDGIRMTATMLAYRKIKVHRERCPKTRDEIISYVWDEKAAQRGEEKPVKQKDHTCDAVRYYVKTMIKPWRLAA